MVAAARRCSCGPTIQADYLCEVHRARPFLKWVGGKRQLTPRLIERIPKVTLERLYAGAAAYYEPMVGGGALFFAIAPHRAVLGDANELLVRTYRAVRDDVDSVIRRLQARGVYIYADAVYYKHRERYKLLDRAHYTEAAAWMIYMNRCGFNGLFRVSGKGNYNVPFGRYTNPTICDAEGLRAASKALKRAMLHDGAFAKAVQAATKGDFVYFDPPYVPRSTTSDFTSYTADGFTRDDQIALRDCARELKKRRVVVMLSNSDTPLVRELYGSSMWKIERVEARRNVNSKANGRGPIGELIIT